MSARSQALVPLSTEQQAAWRAVAETEKRRHQGNTLAEYPYAGAFFRCLNGSRRISLSDLRFFMPSLTAEELHGNRLQWLYAIDVLIETQGEVCLLPLPGDAAERLFPSGHCCKVSDEAAFCLIQRPYISKTLLTRRISPRGSP